MAEPETEEKAEGSDLGMALSVLVAVFVLALCGSMYVHVMIRLAEWGWRVSSG